MEFILQTFTNYKTKIDRNGLSTNWINLLDDWLDEHLDWFDMDKWIVLCTSWFLLKMLINQVKQPNPKSAQYTFIVQMKCRK